MDLHAALGAWGQIAGPDRVSADEAELDRLARTTLPRAPRPVAVSIGRFVARCYCPTCGAKRVACRCEARS